MSPSSSALPWDECTAKLEKKYFINTRDYGNVIGQFNDWCEAKGYGKQDRIGVAREMSPLWTAEFREDVSRGIIDRRPHLDFWQWLVDVTGIQSGDHLELHARLAMHGVTWQAAVLGLYLKEFGHGPFLVPPHVFSKPSSALLLGF